MSVHTNRPPNPHVEPTQANVPGAVARNGPGGRAGALVRGVVSDDRLARAIALLAAAGFGMLAGWWTPRGPHVHRRGTRRHGSRAAGRDWPRGSCSAPGGPCWSPR